MDYILDAKDKKLGRLASEVAAILNGKTEVKYQANKVFDGRVIVKNIDKLNISEKKLRDKIYYRHTGYMGHVKARTLAEKQLKSPQKTFREVIENMLPKNGSRKLKMRKLIIE